MLHANLKKYSSYIKYGIYTICLLFLNISLYGYPERTPSIDTHEEYLRYRVMASGVLVAKIEIWIGKDTMYNYQPVKYMRTNVDMLYHIPFVGKEENRYHSYYTIVNGLPQSLKYIRDSINENIMNIEVYDFNHQTQTIYFYWKNKHYWNMSMDNKYASAGQMILLWLRQTAGNNNLTKYPMYLKGKKEYVSIKNYSSKENLEVQFQDTQKAKLTSCFYSTGELHFKGALNLSGPFKIWLTEDENKIPVKATLSMTFFSVEILLEHYEKLS